MHAPVAPNHVCIREPFRTIDSGAIGVRAFQFVSASVCGRHCVQFRQQLNCACQSGASGTASVPCRNCSVTFSCVRESTRAAISRGRKHIGLTK